MGVTRSPGASLIAVLIALVCAPGAALAQNGSVSAEAVAAAALLDMQAAVARCESDAQEFQTRSQDQFEALAERGTPEKAVLKIERAGEKLFNKFGKLRTKMEKSVDKIAVKAANRIARIGGDPALIEQIDQQRIALRAEANVMLDGVWDDIAAIEQAILDDLNGA